MIVKRSVLQTICLHSTLVGGQADFDPRIARGDTASFSSTYVRLVVAISCHAAQSKHPTQYLGNEQFDIKVRGLLYS